MNKTSVFTTATPTEFAVGDIITIITYKPWYIRLWRYITRYKTPTYKVTTVFSKFTVEVKKQ